MHPTDADANKVELIARLVAVMGRTFNTTEGRDAGVHAVSEREPEPDEA